MCWSSTRYFMVMFLGSNSMNELPVTTNTIPMPCGRGGGGGGGGVKEGGNERGERETECSVGGRRGGTVGGYLWTKSCCWYM